MTDSQRDRILNALLRLVAESGTNKVSVRNVATKAEVSPSQVQYYFRTKDELIAAAFNKVVNDTEAQFLELSEFDSARTALSFFVKQWLPLDKARATNAKVWLAFTAAAVTSPNLQKINSSLHIELCAEIAELLESAQRNSELDPDLDVELHARLLLAVIDGLVVHGISPGIPARYRDSGQQLDEYLESLPWI